MIFPVLECVLGMILYPRYSSHILTLAYGYAMIPFNNHMEVFDTTTYFTHIEHYSTNSLTKGVSSASVIELVINLAFSSLMIKTFSSINKQLEIFILGDDKSKKIWDLTGQSIQCVEGMRGITRVYNRIWVDWLTSCGQNSINNQDLISVNRKGYSFCKEGMPWPNAKDGRSLFITLYSYWENFGWVGSIKWMCQLKEIEQHQKSTSRAAVPSSRSTGNEK
ncbi:hypothetical protein P8452_46814 [Trifolium repens]|nr:hypothetical protein P8452_46814 [Trifolium repens]